MRNNRGKRGQMRVIEVILALFIIVFAIGFANYFSLNPSSPKYQYTELEKLGYNVLHDLDNQGLLPEFVYDGEWENITSALRVTLPINVFFNLTIYQINETVTNDITVHQYELLNKDTASQIFYGESEAFSSNADVASVTYSLVGRFEYDNAEYNPRILVLSLTRG